MKFPSPLEDWLMRAMENFICTSPVQRVLIFLLTARAMGWPARLVLNFDVISFKPEKSLGSKLTEILNGNETKEEKTEEKPSTSKKDDKIKPKSSKRTHKKDESDEDEKVSKPKKSSKSSKKNPDEKSKAKISKNDEKEPKHTFFYHEIGNFSVVPDQIRPT